MKKKVLVFRLISGIMLIVAIVFLLYALTHPESGSVFYIGGVAIGSAVWRAFYTVYIGIMIGLFGASVIFGRTKNGRQS